MSKKATFTHLLIHVGILFFLTLLLSYLFFYWYLPKITHHGESITVPDVRKISFEKAEKLLQRSHLRAVVFDSTYESGAGPLTVINQFPKPGEKVKSDRKIYLTIQSKNPPLVKMPKLLTSSLKAAEITLKSYGLELGNISYKPSVMQGAVLEQWYGQQKIEPGTLIPKGSVVHLVVGNGISSESVLVPDLVGLTPDDAEKVLRAWGLERGSLIYDESRADKPGIVYKQKPEYIAGDTTNKIKLGEIIDLWVSGKKP